MGELVTLDAAADALDHMATIAGTRGNAHLAGELRDLAAFTRLWVPVCAAAVIQQAADDDAYMDACSLTDAATEAAVGT